MISLLWPTKAKNQMQRNKQKKETGQNGTIEQQIKGITVTIVTNLILMTQMPVRYSKQCALCVVNVERLAHASGQ